MEGRCLIPPPAPYLGFIPVGDKPEEFTAYIKAQVEAFRPLVKDLPSP